MPSEIIQHDDQTLEILWQDGQKQVLSAAALRRSCPCAGCVDEWTGKKLLSPDAIPDTIKIENIEPVGRYAIHLSFSDGHETGIFSFTFLRNFLEN